MNEMNTPTHIPGLPLSYASAVEAFERWCDRLDMDPTDTELRHAFLGGIVHVEQFLGIEEGV